MFEFDRDTHFRRLIEGRIEQIDLPTLALEIARDEYPELDIPGCVAQLDRMGSELRGRMNPSDPPEECVHKINRLLFEEEGYRGNSQDYYDPRNSFLNEVLDRKLGIPITLSIVYLAVAERAGLQLRGVGMPAHFVVRLDRAHEPMIIDPFHGGVILNRAECEERVSRVVGLPVRLDDEQLDPSPHDQTVLRLLGNLKAIYVRQDDSPRALRVQQRIYAINRSDPSEIRDLGVLYLQNERPARAVELLESYCELRPTADDYAAVTAMIEAARRLQAQMN